MLILRDAQRVAFADARVRELLGWLLGHVRKHFAVQVRGLDDRGLATLIERAVDRARELGATRSAAITQFVHLRVVFGEDLEARPWAMQALDGSSGDAAIARLVHAARVALHRRNDPCPT